jgi:hypothetical protein
MHGEHGEFQARATEVQAQDLHGAVVWVLVW